jgi:MFS family permease
MTEQRGQRVGGPADIFKIIAAVLISGVGVTSGIAVGGILAQELAGTASAGGLAQTFSILGAGAAAIPLAWIARHRGRRPALMTGYLIGGAGALTILVGGQMGNLPVVLAGMALYGSATAASLQARFAATEYTGSARAARAMSFVVWGSTVGSVVGPNLTNVADLFGESLGLRSLIGPYIFSGMAFIVAIVILSFLRPSAATVERNADPERKRNLPSLQHALRTTLGSRTATFGLAVVVGGQMMMSAVMVMTPVSMHNHGYDLQIIGFVISSHIFGMYALSPIFGWLADRWTPLRVCWLAMGLFSVAIVSGIVDASLAHSSTPLITFALVCLGLGWCGTLIGGSTLLTQALEKDTRVVMQGSSDAMMNFGAAGLAALAGPALEFGGFVAVNLISAAVLLLILLPLGLRAFTRRARDERARMRLSVPEVVDATAVAGAEPLA